MKIQLRRLFQVTVQGRVEAQVAFTLPVIYPLLGPQVWLAGGGFQGDCLTREVDMLSEAIQNPIVAVVERLALMAVVFVPLVIAVVQGVKKLTGLSGVKAQGVAIAINLVFGLSFVAVFFYPAAAVYVGVGMFLLVMAVAPLGGYDLLKKFTPGSKDSP